MKAQHARPWLLPRHHRIFCRMVLTTETRRHTYHWLCRMSLNQFGFALFYFIYVFFGILYIAVGVKIVF